MSSHDTGGPRGFPATRVSVIEAAASGDAAIRRDALEVLVAAYWRPVYLHLRLRWNAGREDAEDLTQEFLARAVEQGFFDGYDPARARFRTFLRTCLDRFAANAQRDALRQKRGGGAIHLSLDFDSAERELPPIADEDDPETRFQQEWVRSLFTLAVETLRGECAGTPREVRFRIFARHDLDPVDGAARPSYRELGEEFDLPVTQVTNHLSWARREFRRLVLERLRALCGSEAEFQEEARALFGVVPT